MAALLLYHFSPGEVVQLQTLLGFLPEVRVIPVERNGYGMTLRDLLDGKTPPPMAFGSELERKLLVVADAEGELFSMLLSAVGQVTRGQNILRAMLTETNQTWTGTYLYRHLLEEEAELERMRR